MLSPVCLLKGAGCCSSLQADGGEFFPVSVKDGERLLGKLEGMICVKTWLQEKHRVFGKKQSLVYEGSGRENCKGWDRKYTYGHFKEFGYCAKQCGLNSVGKWS